MPKYAEQRVMPYAPDQIFDLVADVERYPEFLPWCLGSRITKPEAAGVLEADLLVGFKMVREKFGSRVELKRPERVIDVRYTHGPFRYLVNHWRFDEHADGCLVDFFVDFEFRSRILAKLMGSLFTDAVHRMVLSFETRASELYGPNNAGNETPAPS